MNSKLFILFLSFCLFSSCSTMLEIITGNYKCAYPPSIIDQYKAKNEVLEREIPQLQEIAGKVWKKEEELKQLKSELAALDRKIQLELAPPTPEITEKEHEGQQVKPEAKGVRNGIRQYPEDTSPQIRNPSESIIANHTITGHPGLYAKEETRSKGLKI